jgi:hypothetical protein
MRIFILVPMALLVLISTQAAAQLQWAEFRDESEFFSVNFPGQPNITEALYASEYGATFPSKVYSVEIGDYFYSLRVVDFTAAREAYLELPDKTDEASSQFLWIYDQLAATSYAARKFRERGGELTFDAWHHIDMVEGHQLQITNPDQSRTFAGIYMQNSRLYILEATVPSDALPQGLFQQSISFLDEDGVRIRYVLKEDGSRTPSASYLRRQDEARSN